MIPVLNTDIVLIWMFSCVFAVPCVAWASPLGETMGELRKAVGVIAYTNSCIALGSTILIYPLFVYAVRSLNFSSFEGYNSAWLLMWSALHVGSALYAFLRGPFLLGKEKVNS